jgi:hypothetical protein
VEQIARLCFPDNSCVNCCHHEWPCGGEHQTALMALGDYDGVGNLSRGDDCRSKQEISGTSDCRQEFHNLKTRCSVLHQAKSQKMSDEAFCMEVENLHEKYNELIKAVRPTGSVSFGMARRIVGAKIHEPDQDASGKIK